MMVMVMMTMMSGDRHRGKERRSVRSETKAEAWC
jgi:hypothetical protein